jgi:hypothetical protein
VKNEVLMGGCWLTARMMAAARAALKMTACRIDRMQNEVQLKQGP